MRPPPGTAEILHAAQDPSLLRLGAARQGSGGLNGAQHVSPSAIAALWRRHLAAVALIFVCAAGLGYYIKHEPAGYADTATVAFTWQKGGLFNHEAALLVIDELTTRAVMSPAGQQQIRADGGTASYNVALVNLNNEDYPNYSDPYVTVTTTSVDPGATAQTFSAVMNVLQQDLNALQERQGAKPDTWIQLRSIAAPTGPIAQTGSLKRSLAGLLLLALIAAFMTAKFLDSHPIRLRGRSPNVLLATGVPRSSAPRARQSAD
jgi:hypothetical protein